MFLNYYVCPYDEEAWTDVWDSTCNDRCPVCNREIEPIKSEDIVNDCEEKLTSTPRGI